MSGPIKVSLWSCFTVFIFSHLSASNQFWGGCSARAWCLCGKSLAPWATLRQQQPFFCSCCALPFIQNGLFPFPRSPLSSPVVDSYSVIKAQLKYPSILGKHLPSPPSASRTSLPSALFIPELHGSSWAMNFTGGLYVVMCGKVFVPWGGLWSLRTMPLSSLNLQYSVELWFIVIWSQPRWIEKRVFAMGLLWTHLFFVLDPLILFLMENDV